MKSEGRQERIMECLVIHDVEFEFSPKSDEKPLEGFRQGSDMI